MDRFVGAFFAHFPISLRYLFAILQMVVSICCAGSLYFMASYNQYIGRHGKERWYFTCNIDQLLACLNSRSFFKVGTLCLICLISAIATIGQVIVWSAGCAVVFQDVIVLPAMVIFFAAFSDAGIKALFKP